MCQRKRTRSRFGTDGIKYYSRTLRSVSQKPRRPQDGRGDGRWRCGWGSGPWAQRVPSPVGRPGAASVHRQGQRAHVGVHVERARFDRRGSFTAAADRNARGGAALGRRPASRFITSSMRRRRGRRHQAGSQKPYQDNGTSSQDFFAAEERFSSCPTRSRGRPRAAQWEDPKSPAGREVVGRGGGRAEGGGRARARHACASEDRAGERS